MLTFVNNFEWMGINLFLAILPIVFGYLAVKYNKNISGFIFFVLWFLFFPNSIYLITDIQYLPKQIFSTDSIYTFLLVVQYLTLVILGIVTYFYALKPIVQKFKIHEALIFVFNFVIAFAVALGKLQRTESWYVFLDPIRVTRDIHITLSTPSILLFVVLFGILTNFIWFVAIPKLKGLLSRL